MRLVVQDTDLDRPGISRLYANRDKILGHSWDRERDRHEGATGGHRSRPQREGRVRIRRAGRSSEPGADTRPGVPPPVGADQAPTFPDEGGPTAQPSYFPPVG